MQSDGACSANLGAVPPRVVTGLSTYTLQHSVCLAGNPHCELWRALIAHCVTVAQGRGSDAVPVAGDHHAGMGWGSEAYPGGGELMFGLPGSQGRPMAAPWGGALTAGGRNSRSLGRSRTPRKAAASAPLREAQRARLIDAFGRGASGPLEEVSLALGLGHEVAGGGCQSRSPLLAASVAHDSTNREGSSGSHAATAHGRFAEAFPEGPCARACTHGAGETPMVCGAPLLTEGMYRAGARPMP